MEVLIGADGAPESASRRVVCIHAHPDDEASKGAGTIRRYRDAGVGTVLVCCTGGEEGDIINPAMDRPEVKGDLANIRRRELVASAEVIGYERVWLLGYRDSGMPDSEANANPECFARADLDEAVGRLVAILRRERPHVMVTYSDDQRGYKHPDHLRVHDASMLAHERSPDPAWYPEAGEPWAVSKVYYSTWSRARMEKTHAAFEELGLESPYDKKWFDRPSQDHRITTQVPIEGYTAARSAALLAHETQIDPASPFWFGLPPDVSEKIHPFDDYILATSSVQTEPPESDLFAGISDDGVST